jgi:hypothetical protein
VADFNDLVFGSLSPEQQAAIAGKLRNREALGMLMSMTGDRALAPAGQQLFQNVSAQRQQGINRQYYLEQMKQAQLDRESRDKHYRAMEGLQGKQIEATLAGRLGSRRTHIPVAWQKQVQEGLDMTKALNDLRSRFKPEWASKIPGSGTFRQWSARYAPMLTNKENIEFQKWRRDFEDFYETKYRHSIYGGALTGPEISRWEGITLGKDATPEQVDAFFSTLIQRTEPKLKSDLNAYAEQFGPDAVQGLLEPYVAEGMPEDENPQAPTSYELIDE